MKLTETINFCDPIDESENEQLEDSFREVRKKGAAKSKGLVGKDARQRKKGCIHKRSLSDY